METLLAADLAPATLSSQGGTQGLPLGSQRNVQRKDSTLELVSDINPLEGEDLSGDWWKVQGPPEELYISGDNPSSEKLKNEVKKWVQEVRNTCPLIMDGCDAPEVVVVDPPAYEQTGPSSPCLPTMYEENPAELHNIFPTTVIFGDEKYPVPPSGPISVNRTSTTQSHTHARRISTSSSVARSSTFSGSHVAGMDNRTIGSLEAISVNSRGSVKKKPKPPPPKQEFTSDGSLAYNAYFSPLPANNKVVTSQAPQVSARAEALKKFFGKKKAPGR
ncbi:hypothetical protein L873DRAFT_1040331 [Choiromyces venosus 120613-1]|uniref:Uncharacterized protein n=1 Tax=Choiromyces venosus 120613-1 TaxID=1336337 RepID=A0A3N4JNK5_9PEZI|nr:hypothetical protein L873DRAFT_1040331 [Choiromyces venosus 120613-1]